MAKLKSLLKIALFGLVAFAFPPSMLVAQEWPPTFVVFPPTY